MVRNTDFDGVDEEQKNLGFFKIFQRSDLSSECMRAFPYNFIKKLLKKEFCFKMVIRARWGKTWDFEISKNTNYYYIEKLGWDEFVSDNVLGQNEFITFTHKGKMIFNVNIYEQNGKEMLLPRKWLSGPSSGIKKEEGESGFKNVKKENETDDESVERVELKVRKKRTYAFKATKEKTKSKKAMERGESSRGVVKLKAKMKKAQDSKTSKKMKKRKSKLMKNASSVPEFQITIRNSYLKFLAIPKHFVDEYISRKSKFYTIHHPNGVNSWRVLCLVRDIRTIFSRGHSKLAREYPLLVGDVCVFKLIKPREFVLIVSRKPKEEIMMNV